MEKLIQVLWNIEMGFKDIQYEAFQCYMEMTDMVLLAWKEWEKSLNPDIPIEYPNDYSETHHAIQKNFSALCNSVKKWSNFLKKENLKRKF